MDDFWRFMTATIGAGGLGAVIAVITKYLIDRGRHTRASRKDELVRLQSILDRQEVRIDHLEQQHEECLENNATLQAEVGALREAVRRLEAQLRIRELEAAEEAEE